MELLLESKGTRLLLLRSGLERLLVLLEARDRLLQIGHRALTREQLLAQQVGLLILRARSLGELRSELLELERLVAQHRQFALLRIDRRRQARNLLLLLLAVAAKLGDLGTQLALDLVGELGRELGR